VISGLHFGGGEKIGIASAAVIFIGALLPWVKVTAPLLGSVVRWGFEMDGVMTMILSLMSLAVIAVSKRLVLKRLAIASAGGLIAFIAFINYLDLAALDIRDASVEPGVGLVMSLVGGVGLVASIVPMRAREEEPPLTQDLDKSPVDFD